MATNKTFKQLAAALAVAVTAATAHGVFFAPTEAVSTGAPAAGIRLSTWDHYERQWSIYFIEQHLNDAVNNPAGTLRHSEGAIIELRPVAGELTFDSVPAGLAYTVIADLNALGITAPGDVPVNKDGAEQPQLSASGTPVYIQLNVSTVATSVGPPNGHTGPWAGPIDPTDDDLSALDAGGSVGMHPVTLGATGDTVAFTWDIGRWAKGDLFLGLNNHTYKVLDRTGHFKRFVAVADIDDPDHAAFEWYNETSGCATNWKTGEMFAANFGDGLPAVNVITRHPSAGGRTVYSPLNRRVSTRIERPDYWSWWGIDVNPESVAFDANMNMYVGHSFGNQDDRPTSGDQAYWTGMGFDMFTDSSWYPMGVEGLPREWSSSGSGYIVDETGAKMKLAEAGAPVASYVNKLMNEISPRMQYEADGVTLKFGPAPPAIPGMPDWPAQLPLAYLANPGTGNSYQRLDANDVIVEGLVPARWSMGKRLHRYNIQPDGSYLGTGAVPADRDVFWTFTGRQGTDWMDINSTGDVLYYTSEDSFIHRYRVRLNPEFPNETIGQLPDLGNGRINVGGSADRRFNGLRILPPGDGTGGFLVASTAAIHRLRGDGSHVQSYTINDDAYLWAQNDYSGAVVNGWYSIEVDPGGRTLWAAPTDTGWVYVFDIATGREIHRFEATDYRPYGHPDGSRFVQSMCIMWEYTAAQEICGNSIDDDGDGFVDENCKAIEVCSAANPGDDNGNGLADANDPDCGADEAPVAVDDFFETVQDVPIGIAVNAPNQVLVNDSDPDNADEANRARHDVLTVGLVGTSGTPATAPGAGISTTQGGTVVLNANGSMSYMPAAGFHGLDTFVYQATDAVLPFEGQNYSNTATVTILVRPLVDNDSYEIEQGTSLDVAAASVTPPALLSNDRSDGLTIIGAGPAGISPLGVNPSIQFVTSAGGATVVVYADGRFTYTPPTNFVGTDTFLYRGNDGVSDSVNDAIVTIVVTPVSTTIVTTDPDPSVYGSPATVRATVTCGMSQTPSVGTVTFRLGAQVIATNVPVVNGVATTTLPASLVVGNYTVTAEYSGSATVAPICPGSGDDDPHQVVPKPATVTANPQTKPYGTVFTFNGTEFTTDGFIFEDEVLSATLVSATGSPATATVAGSTYPIVPSQAVGVGLENYTITYINGPLTVTPVPLVITADDKAKVYDGTVFGGPFTVTYSGFVLGEGPTDLGGALTFSGAAGTAVNAATYTDGIVPAGYSASNYTITYEPGTLTITPAPLVVTADDKSKAYDGQVYPGPYTVRYTGFVNDEDPSDLGGALTFSGAALAAVNAGTYTGGIVPAGYTSTNYAISYVPGTLRIDPPVLIITAEDKTKTYDGSVYSPFTVTYSGFVGDDDPSDLGGALTFSGAATTAVNVGTYTGGIVPAGYTSSNYTIQYVAGTLTITPAPLVVTADDKSKLYDGTVYSPFTVTYSGFVGDDDVSDLGGALAFSGAATTAVNVGTYTDGIVPAGYTSSNYTISYVPGTLTITPVPLVVTAVDKSKLYDGTVYSPFTVTYSGFVAGDDEGDLGGALTYSGAATTAVNVGTYTDGIVPAGYTSTNYTITYEPGTLTITPAPLVVTADDKVKTYDGRVYPGPYTVTYSGFVNDEDPSDLGGALTFSGAALAAVNSGTYTDGIVPAGYTSTNYAISYVPGTLRIDPPVLIITAEDKTKMYDGSVYSPFTVTYSGFVGDDNPSDLGGALTFSGAATTAVNVGTYTGGIVPGGYTSTNYTIQYVAGTLTITPAPLVVTADDKSKLYDGTVYSPFTVTYSGFVGDDDVSDLGGALAFSGAATTAVNVGTYTDGIVPAGYTSSNYTISYVPGTLTITPVPLVVTAVDKSKLYDGTVYSPFTVTYSGFVGGDDAGDLGGVLTYSGAATTAVNVGTYTGGIVPAGYTSTNYTISYVSGTLTINPIPATLRANDKSMVEGDPVPTLDGAWTGLLAGEVVGATYSTTGTSDSPAGAYPIDPTPVDTQNVLANYTVTIIPGTLTIRPRIVPCTPTGYITYTQGGWGSKPSGGNPGELLASNFARVYPDGLMIGGTRTLTFTSADAIEAFLPTGGTSKTLTASAVNPTRSTAGVFAGQLLALQLAVDFSEAGVLQSGLGAMVMRSGAMAGKSVNDVLAVANQVLGGNTSVLPSGMSISGLSSLLESIIMNYHEGVDRGGLACGSGYPPPPPPPPPANRPPVALGDEATTVTTTPVSITVLTNDSDPDGDTLTVVPTGFTQPANGSVTLSNNVFRFVAVPGFTGTTTFTYTITDGKGGTATATVSIEVTGTNPPPPDPPSSACTFRTQTQGGWGANPSGGNAAAFLRANFATVFGSAGAVIGSGSRTLTFNSSDAIRRFLPAGGTAGVLNGSAINPTSTSAGVFAGQVLALRISVAFSNAGLTTTGLSALTVKSGALAGYTVGQVLALANTALAGGNLPSGITISTLNSVVDAINNNFVDGNTDKGYLNTSSCSVS